jgi:hypothetical protein
LLAPRADSNQLNATVRWTVARDGLTERNHNFRQRRKCKSSPVAIREKKRGLRASLFWCRRTRTDQMQHAEGMLLAAGLDGGNTIIYSSPVTGTNKGHSGSIIHCVLYSFLDRYRIFVYKKDKKKRRECL